MSEKRSGRAETVIAAPVERVWALVTDVTRTGEWSPENVGGEWLDGAGGPAMGARFRGRNRRGRAKWSTTCEVIACDPGREFSFVTGSAARPDTTWRYRLEPVPGGTRVEESFEMAREPGLGSRLVTRVTTGVRDRRADLEDNVRQSLEALRRVAEEGDS